MQHFLQHILLSECLISSNKTNPTNVRGRVNTALPELAVGAVCLWSFCCFVSDLQSEPHHIALRIDVNYLLKRNCIWILKKKFSYLNCPRPRQQFIQAKGCELILCFVCYSILKLNCNAIWCGSPCSYTCICPWFHPSAKAFNYLSNMWPRTYKNITSPLPLSFKKISSSS